MSNEKKGKELKLDNFKITGDIIKWNGSVIKIANISYVTNDKFELPAFPKLSVVLILFGLLLRSFNTAAFAGCVAAGIAWILYWYFEKEDLKSKTLLTLSMNSGTRIPILFTDENFLKNGPQCAGRSNEGWKYWPSEYYCKYQGLRYSWQCQNLNGYGN